jgi:biotin transport system permease protein
MLTLTSPVETWAHPLPAGLKLAALALATTALFALSGVLPLALAFAATLGLVATGGRKFARAVLRLLWPLWPFVIVVAVWHLWIGELEGGLVIILRLMTAVTLANVVTMTTRLSDMIAVFQWLARPLAPLGLSPRRLALALALVIRFIPVMLVNLTRITDAWSARSRRRPRWRVLVPATLAALDDADRAAEALRARGGAG